MSAFAQSAAVTMLKDDRQAQAYLARRQRDLPALQEDLRPNNEGVINPGYVTVCKTASGWVVDNLPAVSFVAVQAYILARFW